MNKLPNNQSGQVLPFFIVAGTVLLAVIANLSLRNISSGFRSTTLDTASRVTAAAEGGLERFLSYDYDELKDWANTCPPGSEDTPNCQVTFRASDPDTSDDKISAQAAVNVKPVGNSDTFEFPMERDQVYEVNLYDDPIGYEKANLFFCWDGSSDMYYVAYDDTFVIRGYVRSQVNDKNDTGPEISGAYEVAENPEQCPGDTYANRYKVKDLSKITNLLGLRIRPVGDSSETIHAVVYAKGGVLPVQAYEITSRGQISETGDVQSQVTETKTVRVSYPYLPAYFDFGLFAEGGFGN
ncbi:MAG: hypothetical protein WC243_01470 [Patescibacteria group bacterium]